MSYLYNDRLTGMIEGLSSASEDPKLAELRERARDAHIPTAELQSVALLSVIIRMSRTVKILEIGTAWGCSAIDAAQTIGDNARILTVDTDSERIIAAKQNIEDFGLTDRIFPVCARAQDVLEELLLKGKAAPYPVTPPYDLIFMDGPKAHYVRMLPAAKRLLRTDGVLVADNVLFRGLVAEEIHASHRKITIVKRLRRFLEKIENDPGWDSVILPVGDGVSVSVKK